MKILLSIALLAFAHQLCFSQNTNEQIELIPFEFSGVEEVEDLQEDKDIEENGKMLSGLFVPVIHF